MKNEQKFFVSFFQKRKTFLGASDRHQAGHLWARARPPARRIISDRLVFVETLRLPPFAARYAQPQVPTASRPAGAPTSTAAPVATTPKRQRQAHSALLRPDAPISMNG